MNYTLFDKRWFFKHQKVLLFLLNTPIVGKWFRKKLYINLEDDIYAIHPNALFIEKNHSVEPDEMIAIFSSHNRYAKSISLQFRYLWLAIHAWDRLVNFIVDMGYNPIRMLNYGFDELIAYPNADNTAPTDGLIKREGTNESWATIRDNANGTEVNIDSHDQFSQVKLKAGTSNPPPVWAELIRIYYGFDTSAMGVGAVVTGAIFSITAGAGKSCDFNNASYYPKIALCAYSGEDPATTADYDQFGTTKFAEIAWADYDVTASTTRNEFTCNAGGIANVAVDGNSHFGLRFHYDIEDVAPMWSWFDANDSAVLNPGSADAAGTDNDPRLVVTYTPAPSGSASKRLLRGVGL